MAQTNQILKDALAVVEQLPIKLQRQLAERVLAATVAEEETLVVRFQRLSALKQARLTELMDKNNEGRLTRAEKPELRRLSEAVDQVTLVNSKALARVLHPEVFNAAGKPVRNRLRGALNSVPVKHQAKRRVDQK